MTRSFFFISASRNIRKWTEESFKSPPFNLALQTEWLSTPRVVKLKDIYTNLRWVHIHRKPCDVLKQDIDGYWQMLMNKELGDGPVRILVEGIKKQNNRMYLKD